MTPASAIAPFVASGLLSRAEAVTALARALDYPTEPDAGLDAAITAHELPIVARVRAAILPLIACRACSAALLAEARHANGRLGRLNALPEPAVQSLVDEEIAAAIRRRNDR